MSEKPQRLADLDWLRVLAGLLLIPFHAALIWGSGVDDHWLKDTPLPLPDLFAHFVHQWHMPLLFIIAGMAAWFNTCPLASGPGMRGIRVTRAGPSATTTPSASNWKAPTTFPTPTTSTNPWPQPFRRCMPPTRIWMPVPWPGTVI